MAEPRLAAAARTAWPVAAALALAAALFCLRPLGVANALVNSWPVIPLLSLSFLAAYGLGYLAGLTAGLTTLAPLMAALEVANGTFNPLVLMITLGPWLAGRIIRSRRQLAEQLRARNAELAAQQEAYAAEAVRYERSRIAAELHDLVGHALSLMVVQAGAGQRAPLTGSGAADDKAEAALRLVADAAREAQAEVAALAGLMSGDPPAGGPRGLDLVAELVRQVRAAGVDVTYRLSGDGVVDHGPAETASRVVTESLTNALKHAPGAPVTVDVRACAGELAVTVGNGPAAAASDGLGRAGGGYGLAAMRDRVAEAGGRLSAGPSPDGGWRVRAVLPARSPDRGPAGWADSGQRAGDGSGAAAG
jgi:signal transduction histidine kinase